VNLPLQPRGIGAPLSPEAQQLRDVLENLAAQIVVHHPQADVVAFDQVLSAALSAHAMHHYLKCGIRQALEAYDLPQDAAPIAERLVGLTMAQAEAVRLMARATVWAANFKGRDPGVPTGRMHEGGRA
jgi:hypothetical protein